MSPRHNRQPTTFPRTGETQEDVKRRLRYQLSKNQSTVFVVGNLKEEQAKAQEVKPKSRGCF